MALFILNGIALAFHEVMCPQDHGGCAVSIKKFGVSTGLGVDFLFPGHGVDGTGSYTHGHAHMTFKVKVNCKKCVNKPFNHIEIVGQQSVDEIMSTREVAHEMDEFVPVNDGWDLYSGTKVGNGRLYVGSTTTCEKKIFGYHGVEKFLLVFGVLSLG